MAFTFAGTAGQRVTFGLVPSSGLGWQTTVYNPDGSILWGSACCGNTWVELLNMTQTGTYKIGRASSRERAEISVVAVSLKKKDRKQASAPTNAGTQAKNTTPRAGQSPRPSGRQRRRAPVRSPVSYSA